MNTPCGHERPGKRHQRFRGVIQHRNGWTDRIENRWLLLEMIVVIGNPAHRHRKLCHVRRVAKAADPALGINRWRKLPPEVHRALLALSAIMEQ